MGDFESESDNSRFPSQHPNIRYQAAQLKDHTSTFLSPIQPRNNRLLIPLPKHSVHKDPQTDRVAALKACYQSVGLLSLHSMIRPSPKPPTHIRELMHDRLQRRQCRRVDCWSQAFGTVSGRLNEPWGGLWVCCLGGETGSSGSPRKERLGCGRYQGLSELCSLSKFSRSSTASGTQPSQLIECQSPANSIKHSNSTTKRSRLLGKD